MLLFSCSLKAQDKGVEWDDFYALMGQSKNDWNTTYEVQDQELLTVAKKLYQKNKDAQFLRDGPFKIPPVIHLIWLGSKPFPFESVENVRTWIAHHPGWRVKLWTDREKEPPCTGVEMVLINDSHFSCLARFYQASEDSWEKSNLLRYEILFREGGVYADHDMRCLRSFDGIHRGYDFYCCLETPHEAFVGRKISCGNEIIGACPGHPVMARTIRLIADRWDLLGKKFRGKDTYSRAEMVVHRTYIPLTDALPQTIGLTGNRDIILPAAYFFSKSGMPVLYAERLYASLWDDLETRLFPVEKYGRKALGKIQESSSDAINAVVSILCANVLILALCLRHLKGIRKNAQKFKG